MTYTALNALLCRLDRPVDASTDTIEVLLEVKLSNPGRLDAPDDDLPSKTPSQHEPSSNVTLTAVCALSLPDCPLCIVANVRGADVRNDRNVLPLAVSSATLISSMPTLVAKSGGSTATVMTSLTEASEALLGVSRVVIVLTPDDVAVKTPVETVAVSVVVPPSVCV